MSRKSLTPAEFRDDLLSIMDQKNHWAWPMVTGPDISKEQLKIHYQQEYLVYVRDFPVFLARVHGQSPPADVRRMLAENIYEEDTGGLSFGRSHPQLFHEMMEGLGFDMARFERARLLSGGAEYRRWIERCTANRDWVIGAAVMAIFVEGSVKDRKEISEPSKPKTQDEIEAYVSEHHLVRHQKIARDRMDLIRAHQQVEAGHRQDAYDMVTSYATTHSQQETVIACVRKSLTLWYRYRDGVARACKLIKQ